MSVSHPFNSFIEGRRVAHDVIRDVRVNFLQKLLLNAWMQT